MNLHPNDILGTLIPNMICQLESDWENAREWAWPEYANALNPEEFLPDGENADGKTRHQVAQGMYKEARRRLEEAVRDEFETLRRQFGSEIPFAVLLRIPIVTVGVAADLGLITLELALAVFDRKNPFLIK